MDAGAVPMNATRNEPDVLERLRRMCLDLPEAHEVIAWGEPTFRVRKRIFAMFADASNHHGSGRPAVWLKAGPGEQQVVMKLAPDRYFSPPYVGKSGWIGVWLDDGLDWDELADKIEDAYRLIAPKRLLAAHPTLRVGRPAT